MSDDALVVVLTTAIVMLAGSIGLWLGLRLVRGSDLKADRPRLNQMTVAIWISAAFALGVWLLSDGKVSFTNACFGFGLASIAIFAALRRPKAS